MKRLVCLIIISIFLLSSFVNAGAYLTLESRYEGTADTSNGRTKRDVFYDGFDTGYGASPGGYVTSAGSVGYAEVVDISDEILIENGAFKFVDSEPGESFTGIFMNKKLEDIPGNIAFEFKFMLTNSPDRGDFGVRLYMDGSTTDRPMFVITHRAMEIAAGGTRNSLGSVKPNKWYTFRAVLRRDENKLDVIFTSDDGVLTIRNMSYEGEKISEIGVFSQRGDTAALFDYIKIESNPPLLEKEEKKIIEAPRVADPVPHTVYGKINIFMDGRYRYFTNEPLMDNERVLVPLRSIFEDLGAEVSYRSEDKTAIIVINDKNIEISAGNTYLTVNGERKETDVAAKIYKDRIYVPVRAITESIGAKVGWIAEESTVTIETPGFANTSGVTENKEEEEK